MVARGYFEYFLLSCKHHPDRPVPHIAQGLKPELEPSTGGLIRNFLGGHVYLSSVRGDELMRRHTGRLKRNNVLTAHVKAASYYMAPISKRSYRNPKTPVRRCIDICMHKMGVQSRRPYMHPSPLGLHTRVPSFCGVAFPAPHARRGV
jgi:hypothetical protein